jgi:hypothetical protein
MDESQPRSGGQGDFEHPELGDSIEEVAVARYDGQPEAEMWAELLRGEGIPTVVIQLLPGARLAWGMVPCELRVRSTDVARARVVLGLEP